MAFGTKTLNSLKKLTPAQSVSKKAGDAALAQSGLGPYLGASKLPVFLDPTPTSLAFNLGDVKAAADPSKNPYLAAKIDSVGGGDTRAMGGSPLTGGYVDPASVKTAGGNGSVNMTGYAKQFGYTPDSLDGIINQHPEILSSDVLRSMGIKSTGLASQLADEAGVAQLVATILASQNGKGLDNNSTANAIAQYFQQRVTPGGGSPDVHYLVNALLNAGKDTPLYSLLGLGDGMGQTADQQAQAIDKAIYGVMNDQNGYTQQATKNYLAQQASDYAKLLATNPAAAGTTYQDYLKAHSALQNWFG